MLLAERLEAPVLQTGQAGSIPAEHFEFNVVTIGDRLTVGCLALNQVMEVQVLLPELTRRWQMFVRLIPE